MRGLACLALAGLLGCSTTTDGPTPSIQSVAPSPVCTAQQDQTITITGSGFAPVIADALTGSPFVAMPQVFLDAGDASAEIPQANIATPDTTGTTLEVAIPAGLVPPTAAGEPVAYTVRVRNPTGKEATLADALQIVGPPDLVSVDPTSGGIGRAVTITLTGVGFLPNMTVTLDASPSVTATDVMVAEDGTSATAMFNLTGVAEGTYSITVTNEAGCSDTLPGAFMVTATYDLMLTGIDPPFGCTCDTTNITISSAAGFVSTPRVEMRPAGQASPVTLMTRVAFVDASTITAVVPSGLDLGLYDITVTNPPSDGGVGQLPGAFRVVSLPIVSIEAIVPERGDSGSNTPVSIFGENFRDPVKIELIDRLGNIEGTVASVTPVSTTQIDATLPTMGMMDDAYLVRVTNLDQDTYSTFSSFIVGSTGPSGNLNTFATTSPLATGRRMLASVSARDDLGNTYIYAIGGDTGASGMVLDSVEVAQLSKFGDLAPWRQIRAPNQMTTTRGAPSAVSVPVFDPSGSPFIPVKTYVYVTGGRNNGGTVLGSVERAMVLRAADAPVITAGASTTAGTLAAGTWYYKVSAVMADNDADNPGGETLPSDEAIVTLGTTGAIDLSWNAVAGAVSYRVYRTAAVDGASQQELLIESSVTATSYTDTGATAGAEAPLPPGALGKWVTQTATHGIRWGHQAALITESASLRYLVVLGGKSDATTGYLSTIEIAPIDAQGQLGSFAAGTTAMPTPRAFFSLTVETPQNVSSFSGLARLFICGGVDAGGSSDDVERSDITAGGANGAWTGAAMTLTRTGPMAVIKSDKLFILGGAGMATATAFSNIRSNGEDIGFGTDGLLDPPFQAVGAGLPAARALGGVTVGAGFIYFIGGTSSGTDAVATVYQTF